MFRRVFLLSSLATPMIRWFRPWEGLASTLATVEGANAADLYLKAFGWAKGFPQEDLDRLQQAATIAIDDPNVSRLIDQAGPTLDAIRAAAEINTCRWEPEIPTLEDLTQGRMDYGNLNVVRVACLSARRLTKQGQGHAALDDLFAALTLAHRVGTGGVLLARIFEYSNAVTVFKTLGHLLPTMDRAILDELSRRLDDLPPPEPASATVEVEARFILGLIRTKLAPIGPVIGDNQWGEAGFSPSEGIALKRITGSDRDRLLVHLDATVPAFAELGRRLDLPRLDCRTAVDEFARTEASTHPIAVGLVDSAWNVRHIIDRMRAYRAMVHAGLILVRDGQPAFQAERDPFGTGEFQLERRGQGFLIRSSLRGDDRPEVSLVIGAAP